MSNATATPTKSANTASILARPAEARPIAWAGAGQRISPNP